MLNHLFNRVRRFHISIRLHRLRQLRERILKNVSKFPDQHPFKPALLKTALEIDYEIRAYENAAKLIETTPDLVDKSMAEVRQQVEAEMRPVHERGAVQQRQRVEDATEEVKDAVRQLKEVVRVRVD